MPYLLLKSVKAHNLRQVAPLIAIFWCTCSIEGNVALDNVRSIYEAISHNGHCQHRIETTNSPTQPVSQSVSQEIIP